MKLRYSWTKNLLAFDEFSKDIEYIDVQFDWASGGLIAIHQDHCFDKTDGPYGCKRGDYERHVVEILRAKGHRIVLLSETSDIYEGKHNDCLYDGFDGEIKTVESDGHWAVRTKFYQTAKQGASCLILHFPNEQLFKYNRVFDGWQLFLSDPRVVAQNIQHTIHMTYVVVGGSVLEIEKPPG